MSTTSTTARHLHTRPRDTAPRALPPRTSSRTTRTSRTAAPPHRHHRTAPPAPRTTRTPRPHHRRPTTPHPALPAHRPHPPRGFVMAPEPPLLTMSGITKSFPGVRALDGVDLEVQAGEVHCLLGQNGAGKSTLIKVLAGAHQPDGGTITWRGETVTLKSPIAAMRLGIATIYQELDLVEGLSVAENVFLGHEPTSAGFVVRGGEARAAAARLLKRLGHPEIDAVPARRRPVRRAAADRLHGASALPRRTADRDGRAVRGPRPRRGRQPLPYRRRPDRRRRRRRLHLAPPGGDPPHR